MWNGNVLVTDEILKKRATMQWYLERVQENWMPMSHRYLYANILTNLQPYGYSYAIVYVSIDDQGVIPNTS